VNPLAGLGDTNAPFPSFGVFEMIDEPAEMWRVHRLTIGGKIELDSVAGIKKDIAFIGVRRRSVCIENRPATQFELQFAGLGSAGCSDASFLKLWARAASAGSEGASSGSAAAFEARGTEHIAGRPEQACAGNYGAISWAPPKVKSFDYQTGIRY